MRAFDFDARLVDRYAAFSRSFTDIRSEDLKSAIDREYAAGRFWPDSLLSLNPRFKVGASIDELVASGDLDEATGRIFRRADGVLRLYRHQAQAVAKAKARKSFVVTTGTGSGKSLCFFVPIVDAIVRALKAGQPHRTRAIIIYPMNALANSQIKEIQKFVSQADLPLPHRPLVGRYTGQEGREERERMAENPPDILLTNFMMAELLLTRQDTLDTTVMNNAAGLEFIVLDELHTYRGRQGADVAVLVRRLKNRCTPTREPICIGTSATMASEGTDAGKAQAVAGVASRLFGADVGADAVIDESLQRATDESLRLEDVQPRLADVLQAGIPETLTDETLRRHPLAVWAELAIGLNDELELKRKDPIPFGDAVQRLADHSGLPTTICRDAFVRFLTLASLPEHQRGGEGGNAFLAFKLHRFISGAGEIYTTLTGKPRNVFFEGQLEDPSAPGNRLYPTRFCKGCGQEVHVVTRSEDTDGKFFLPRNIDETPRDLDDDEAGETAGYLVPCADEDDENYRFTGDIDTYPEEWKEVHNGIERLRTNRAGRAPKATIVNAVGRVGSGGRAFWFVPGRFSFCPCCLDQPHPTMRERTKLLGLSGEGRSSATTLIVSTALEWMNHPESTLPVGKRKLLGFTDNRQDAALQAGHFNDFLYVSLLRGAVLRAVLDAGADGLGEDEFGLKAARALGFQASSRTSLVHWMLEPDSGIVAREDAQRTLAKVLAHRVWIDLRRGWRYTNPSLLDLALLSVHFSALDEIDDRKIAAVWPTLEGIGREGRIALLRHVLEFLLGGLAIHTESLELAVLDGISQKSRNLLRVPWAVDKREILRSRTTCVLQIPARESGRREDSRDEQVLLRAGLTSRLGRKINRDSVLGARLKRDDYNEVVKRIFNLLKEEGLIVDVDIGNDIEGWRLNPSAVRIVPGPALDQAGKGNEYFRGLYRAIAADLESKQSAFLGLESREHTAQVKPDLREWREWRFRYEQDDIEQLNAKAQDLKNAGEPIQFLPALFCSPTMELGVDISALNAVYLRNVPPTPANYAQRAGRAGRSGQAAVIVTYCAALSPHDQYFFSRRKEMVAGVVRPPAIDITNEELVRSHLHAVWMAESKLALAADIPDVLDIGKPDYPLKAEILETIQRPSLSTAVRGPMKQVLDQIIASVGGVKPAWLGDPDDFVAMVADDAPKRFDEAFARWRDLYHSARTQLAEANRKSMIAGLSMADRQKNKGIQMQAQDQIAILEQGRATNGSDFYSYRYLATEGFLPGYNFPRLPLYAFIRTEGKSGSFLQRARFLAISEFGPRSLIYHEGRSYRVVKAKLPPDASLTDGSDLATKDIFICSNCGASHDDEVERCHACDAAMAGQLPIKRTLRIDNVEAEPVERITANDEERVRQGFDIQTVFSWPRRDGRIEVTQAGYFCGDNLLFTLQYANSADISRINKGLKRRKEQTIYGFSIDPRNGYWVKSDDDEDDSEPPPDVARPVRVVPIVRDRKNALLLRFDKPELRDLQTIATVRHALLRGIEIEFQLEEGEVLGEPLPSRENPRTILAYEATEGGAGVLGQMMGDVHAMRNVARQALLLMHFDRVDEAIAAGDASLLMDQDHACVRGCYRCLLSYYNQPDHERIDRTRMEAKQFLVDLARGQLGERTSPAEFTAAVPGGLTSLFQDHGIPAPDPQTLQVADQIMPYVWRSHRVAASQSEIGAPAQQTAGETGWALFQLPETPSEDLPASFLEAFYP